VHDVKLDPRLLEPLHALLEERHVTRAAMRCGLTQPAMSRVLQRVRSVVGDELLVRTNGKYALTPRGESLFLDLRELLPQIDRAIKGVDFDPLTVQAIFRIAMTEGLAALLVPTLLWKLARLAPSVRIEIVSLGESTFDDVESGMVDLAFVWMTGAERRMENLTLFKDDYVCLVATAHPVRGDRMSLAQYLQYDHAMFSIAGSSQPRIDQLLAERGTPRRVGLRAPFVFPALLATASSTMILTVTRLYAAIVTSKFDLRVLDAPEELGSVEYGMAWHARSTGDAQVWLRRQIRDVVADLTGSPGRGRPSAS
jgi:DNA-binding transcriptional LysR family regulator